MSYPGNRSDTSGLRLFSSEKVGLIKKRKKEKILYNAVLALERYLVQRIVLKKTWLFMKPLDGSDTSGKWHVMSSDRASVFPLHS